MSGEIMLSGSHSKQPLTAIILFSFLMLVLFFADVKPAFAMRVDPSGLEKYNPVQPSDGGKGSGQTAVDVYVVPFIRISAPNLVEFPAPMQIGMNNVSGVVQVWCNTHYEVDVLDENPTAWHLTEWDGTSYQTQSLSEPLHVHNVTQGYDVTKDTAFPRLITGDVTGQVGNKGQQFILAFQQRLYFNDAVLPANETYRLKLTFIGYMTV